MERTIREHVTAIEASAGGIACAQAGGGRLSATRRRVALLGPLAREAYRRTHRIAVTKRECACLAALSASCELKPK